jgi:hypothetical protein
MTSAARYSAMFVRLVFGLSDGCEQTTTGVCPSS